MKPTLGAMFLEVSEQHAHRPALLHKADGQYRAMTWQRYRELVLRLANWLVEADLAAGDRVALLCETRYEWVVADMAMHQAALVNVPVYPTLTARQLAYILQDSGARALIVSDRKQLDKAIAIAPECPDLRQILVIDDVAIPPADLPILRWSEALSRGELADAQVTAHRAERLAGVEPTSLCSIIYTSGTTGEPKGVMLSHRNFLTNVAGTLTRLPATPADTTLSFLPLSHILERITCYTMTAVGATIAFAESLDALARNLQEVRPTIFTTVPRLLEKLEAEIRADLDRFGRFDRRLCDWALAIGQASLKGEADTVSLRLADSLIFTRLRRRLGGRLRMVFCGGAPLPRQAAEFFATVGVPVCEGYGLTETGPVVALNKPDDIRFGTVGLPLPEVTVRIAEDGEICVKGPGVMMGYYRRAEETGAAIDAAGWFHTGDLGDVDPDGYLMITGRKKELIVLSNGKKVAPQPIEKLLASSPYVAHALVVGDNRKYLAALLVPNLPALQAWAEETGLGRDPGALLTGPDTRALFRREVSRLTADLAQFEKIKRFTILSEQWSSESGELTPTQKCRRPMIEAKHAAVIDALFREPETISA